jgi:hypothetical protein
MTPPLTLARSFMLLQMTRLHHRRCTDSLPNATQIEAEMLDCAPAASETTEGERQRQPVTLHILILLLGSIARGDAAQVNVTCHWCKPLKQNCCWPCNRVSHMAAAAVSIIVYSDNTV